jgi:hypothetical protein
LAGLPRGLRVKRRLQIPLASPTGPAHVEVSSDIMKTSFSATLLERSVPKATKFTETSGKDVLVTLKRCRWT